MEQNCPKLSIHEPHDYTRRGEFAWCPGVEHDHEKRCCAEHRHHVTPHRGCAVR